MVLVEKDKIKALEKACLYFDDAYLDTNMFIGDCDEESDYIVTQIGKYARLDGTVRTTVDVAAELLIKRVKPHKILPHLDKLTQLNWAHLHSVSNVLGYLHGENAISNLPKEFCESGIVKNLIRTLETQNIHKTDTRLVLNGYWAKMQNPDNTIVIVSADSDVHKVYNLVKRCTPNLPKPELLRVNENYFNSQF